MSAPIAIATRIVGLVILAAAVGWCTVQLANVVLVVLVALIIVGTIDPLVAWLVGRGFGRRTALATVFVLLTVALIALLILIIPAVVGQVYQVTTEAPAARDKLVKWLGHYE